jgi:thymidylate kinase
VIARTDAATGGGPPTTTGDVVHVVMAVANAWNAAGVEYVVLGGLQDYPQRIGRDIDVVVGNGEGGRVLEIASSVLRANGWALAHPPDTWGPRLVAFKGTHGIEIHTVEQLTWGFAVLYAQPRAEGRAGPFKVDPHGVFVKQLVLPLLGGRFGKVASTRLNYGASEIEEHLRRLLPSGAREGDVASIVERLAGGDRSEIAVARSLLASAINRRAVRTQWHRMPRLGAAWITTRLKRYFRRSGVIVALVGPDGAGKSSVAKAIEAMEDSVFTDVHLRHWRPGLLPDLGRLARIRPAHDGGSVPPRRRAGRFYWLRLLYYSLDFLIGHHVKDRWILGRQVIVLYDRAFLDMMVDPVRYGLGSTRGMMHIWRFLPKPDVVIVLRDEPERIHARKPELPVAEIRRQLDAWSVLMSAGAVGAAIDVEGPPHTVAEHVMQIVVQEFLARFAATGRVTRGVP